MGLFGKAMKILKQEGKGLGQDIKRAEGTRANIVKSFKPNDEHKEYLAEQSRMARERRLLARERRLLTKERRLTSRDVRTAKNIRLQEHERSAGSWLFGKPKHWSRCTGCGKCMGVGYAACAHKSKGW